MERILTIKGRTGLFDSPSFILSENESLQIKFDLKDEIRVGRFRVVVKHGEQKLVFTLSKTEPIILPAEFLKQSKENVEFSLVFLNATATAVLKDDYNIEPLKVETVEGNFAFTAQLQAYEQRQEAFEERLNGFMEQLEAFKGKLNEFEDSGVPLLFEE